MDGLKRILSKPQAKPFRSKKLNYNNEIHLDENGLLTWSPNDVENPKNWSKKRRWFITIVAIVLVVNGSMASSSPSACIPSIMEELGVSAEAAKLTVTLFVLGFCAGPCLWAPLSEYYGRREIFALTFICYFAFTFLCAFSKNLAGLLVGRFLCGTFISGALSNTPGIFADLWGPIERGICMTLFTCALQMGPAVGPITSGFYQLKLNYRWNFYQLLWMAGFSGLFLPLIPETLPSRALLNKARRVRAAQIPGYENVKAPIEVQDSSLLHNFKVALTRPWSILFDPIAGLLAIYMTLVYTLLYMLFTIFPIAFIDIRGWNSGVGELPLLSVCVGGAFAGIFIYWDSSRQRKNIAQGHVHVAEDTLTIGLVGSVAFPVGMFILSWTGAYASVHWIAPCIGGVILSFAIGILFVSSLGYLSETYLMYAASAQAGNQIVRSGVAASSPLYTQQMFDKLTVGGGGSLIAGVAVLLMPMFFVFYRYGSRIRAKSRFAPSTAAHTPKTESSSSTEGAKEEKEEAREEVERTPSETESTRSKPRSVDERFIESGNAEKGDSGSFSQ